MNDDGEVEQALCFSPCPQGPFLAVTPEMPEVRAMFSP